LKSINDNPGNRST